MNIQDLPKFEGLAVSSKFAICGLPIRLDSYRTCSFGCRYCFANGRKIMEFDKDKICICNTEAVRKRLDRISWGDYNSTNFLDILISKGITWHCGGMSDPFQPIEEQLGITSELIDITSEYKVRILFSTKSDTVYKANINPDYHTFQLSISNVFNRKDIEPNVPDITSRLSFFRLLKREGFKVGIRIQPFIPDVTTLDVVKMFEGADHFTLEGIKVVPQFGEQQDFIFNELKIKPTMFTQMGLLNLKPQYRLRYYQPFIDYFKAHNISYSISDNDLRKYTNNKCCCGDRLVPCSTRFNTTRMIVEHPKGYTIKDIKKVLTEEGVVDCHCSDLFTSNRTQGCKTVGQFFSKRFGQVSSPFSPKFQYQGDRQIELFN